MRGGSAHAKTSRPRAFARVFVPGIHAAVVAAVMLCAVQAHAQDFSTAEPAGPSASSATLLEHGLAAPGAFRAEALATSWLGVSGLFTRAVCATAAVHSVRAAAGWSQTGEPGSGWTSAGLGLGAATRSGGVAVRAVARRDADEAVGASGRNGVELGGGAWIAAKSGIVVWAQAPQIVTAGLGTPLPRALTVGVAVEQNGLGAWFEREAPARSGADTGTHAAGAFVVLDAARVWIEGRGRPLRTGFGLTVGMIGVRVLTHPRLGDTVTLSVGFPAHPSTPRAVP